MNFAVRIVSNRRVKSQRNEILQWETWGELNKGTKRRTEKLGWKLGGMQAELLARRTEAIGPTVRAEAKALLRKLRDKAAQSAAVVQDP